MRAIFGCPILIGCEWVEGQAILIEGARISAIIPAKSIPENVPSLRLDSGYLAPGFIDLQVNGGGGVLFNDAPGVETISTIANAHRAFGTTGLLPTLISDAPSIIAQAIAAVDEAIRVGIPGILGIHIEGPVLNSERRGVHDDSRFRKLDDELIDTLCSLKNGKTLVTLAPEQTSEGQIAELVARGIIVWAGHTNADYETAKSAVNAGLSGFTHLYNAMSPLASRAPGVVGAALDLDHTFAGIIADGYHVDDTSLRIAIKCKGIEKTVLVTDAMPSVGAPEGFSGFDLFGEWVDATGPRLTIEAGNLAGSSLDMISAVHHASNCLNVSLADAIKMATSSPAHALGMERELGDISVGKMANLVHLDQSGCVSRTWTNGGEHVHTSNKLATKAAEKTRIP